MVNYNFKNFFTECTPIHNDEWVTNKYFMIKKSVLKKSQLDYINSFEQNDITINKLKENVIKKEINKPIITEFIPNFIGVSRPYDVVFMELGKNRNKIGIQKEYYNFIKSIKCNVYIIDYTNTFNCLAIYNNNEFVGIILPVKLDNVTDIENYKEYIERKKYEEEIRNKIKKEQSKKCLYISNNKAVVRHKELTCIVDIIKDEAYKNLYVESDYKKDGGKVFIDFGFILMHISYLSQHDIRPEDIKYRLEQLKDFTLQDYKNYITECLNSNQFINVAEIKLMELAGESEEYIQTLIEYRQNYLDRKIQENKEREQKRQQEEQEYIEKKNNEVVEMILKAEQAIINKETVQNKDITVYKSKYEYNTMSLVLYLMKQYDTNVPLKTQGWINNALAQIEYNKSGEYWTYRYYTSSANSTVFNKYLNELIKKIEKKYQKVV